MGVGGGVRKGRLGRQLFDEKRGSIAWISVRVRRGCGQARLEIL